MKQLFVSIPLCEFLMMLHMLLGSCFIHSFRSIIELINIVVIPIQLLIGERTFELLGILLNK